VTTVEQDIAHAGDLLTGSDGLIEQARVALRTDDRTTAVARARAAEEAVGRAVGLLDAVADAGTQIVAAAQGLDLAVASLRADLDDVARLASDDPAVRAAADAARQAVATVPAERTGIDPVGLLRHLRATEV